MRSDAVKVAVFCVLGMVATMPHSQPTALDMGSTEPSLPLSFALMSALAGVLVAPSLMELLSGTASNILQASDDMDKHIPVPASNSSASRPALVRTNTVVCSSAADAAPAEAAPPPAACATTTAKTDMRGGGRDAASAPPALASAELIREEEGEDLDYLVLFRSRSARCHSLFAIR